MTTPTLADRFVSVLRPAQRPGRCNERADCNCRTCAPRAAMDDEQYAEFVLRVLAGWERRVIDNPEMLTVNRRVEAAAGEIANVAIAINADRYAIDPRSGVSMLECMRILGITSKATISGRRARGVAAMKDRIDRAGAADFQSFARDRRSDVQAARAEGTIYLADYRARRAA